MVKVDPLKYDRSVSPDFLSHFLRGGCAASLREYAHARYPIDFQFRKDPKNERQWATLYVGMTGSSGPPRPVLPLARVPPAQGVA